eukprot:Gb_09097 [translate_table: standard]
MANSVAAILAIGIGLIALLIGLDPLGISPVANLPNFTVKPAKLHPLSSLSKVRDPHNRLTKAETAAVVDGALGPESLAFDSQGRGPYTGVSDGRILRWDGSDVRWTEFAITSPNRGWQYSNCLSLSKSWPRGVSGPSSSQHMHVGDPEPSRSKGPINQL